METYQPLKIVILRRGCFSSTLGTYSCCFWLLISSLKTCRSSGNLHSTNIYIIIHFSLAEPHTGFHVAFQMLDADGDEMVEKKEFFKVSRF